MKATIKRINKAKKHYRQMMEGCITPKGLKHREIFLHTDLIKRRQIEEKEFANRSDEKKQFIKSVLNMPEFTPDAQTIIEYELTVEEIENYRKSFPTFLLKNNLKN